MTRPAVTGAALPRLPSLLISEGNAALQLEVTENVPFFSIHIHKAPEFHPRTRIHGRLGKNCYSGHVRFIFVFSKLLAHEGNVISRYHTL